MSSNLDTDVDTGVERYSNPLGWERLMSSNIRSWSGCCPRITRSAGRSGAYLPHPAPSHGHHDAGLRQRHEVGRGGGARGVGAGTYTGALCHPGFTPAAYDTYSLNPPQVFNPPQPFTSFLYYFF